MPLRRSLSVAAVLVAVMALAATALAKPATTRTHRLSGVVAAINVAKHTLRLRVSHGARGHSHSARVAVAGSGTLVVSFADASVNGPHGAVAVGDRVTVITNGPIGSSANATAIDVIGQPNGGDAGRGAAIPGTVTALDAAAGTLTLAPGSTAPPSSEAQDSAAGDATVTVSVTPTTILAVGDSNGDGTITLDDISIGDHVVVFTADATTDPIVAVGILDASAPGADSHQGGSSPQGSGDGGDGDGSGASSPTYQAFAGTVATLAPPDAVTVTVSGDGPLAGQTVTVDVTASTHYKGISGYGAIAVGDSVAIYALSLTPAPIVAAYLGDGTGGSDSTPPPPPPPTGDATAPTRFGGTVTDVRGDGLTVTVTSGGALSGQSVIVAVPAGVTFVGVSGIAGINVGDVVEIHTTNASASPVVATEVSDDGVASS